MRHRIFRIIPPSFRRRAVRATVCIFLRALLNFVGLAVLIPVLVLIVDARNIHVNSYLSRAYDQLGFTDERVFVAAVCAAVVGVVIAKCLLSLALFKVERNFTFDLYRHLSRRLYTTYHDRGLTFVKNSNSAVLTRNVNAVSLTFVAGVLKPMAAIASECILFAMLFAALALYNPTAAALAAAIFVPATAVYYLLVRKRLVRYGDEENRAHRAKARCVSETFRGYSDIEINNAFDRMLQTFDDEQQRIIALRKRSDTIAALPQIFTETGLVLGMAAIVLLLGMDGRRTEIMFGILAVAALRLMPSVRSIMSGWTAVKYNLYTIDVLLEADLGDGERESSGDTSRLPLHDAIRVENVSFRFDDERGDREIFHDLSLTIRRGERLGIRGTSGAGKTTLFNLLLGFYRPTAGRITIDGVTLDASTRRRWQNTVGYVSQNVFITDSSFAQNVALGAAPGDIDRERVRQALEAADLGDFIAALPKGMDTPIGECGCRLSGGQRQRIGIARALYKQADVLFFDEATSSLDNRTEESINRSISELSERNRELTIVVIAHRESSLDYCDRIITVGNDDTKTRI